MIRTVPGKGYDELMKRQAVLQALDEAAKADLISVIIIGRDAEYNKRWVKVSAPQVTPANGE